MSPSRRKKPVASKKPFVLPELADIVAEVFGAELTGVITPYHQQLRDEWAKEEGTDWAGMVKRYPHLAGPPNNCATNLSLPKSKSDGSSEDVTAIPKILMNQLQLSERLRIPNCRISQRNARHGRPRPDFLLTNGTPLYAETRLTELEQFYANPEMRGPKSKKKSA